MRDIRAFENDDFFLGASSALQKEGFVTDEHPFAPYKDVLERHMEDVRDYLKTRGAEFDLGSGHVLIPVSGTTYFLYNKNKLSYVEAERKVRDWIEEGSD